MDWSIYKVSPYAILPSWFTNGLNSRLNPNRYLAQLESNVRPNQSEVMFGRIAYQCWHEFSSCAAKRADLHFPRHLAIDWAPMSMKVSTLYHQDHSGRFRGQKGWYCVMVLQLRNFVHVLRSCDWDIEHEKSTPLGCAIVGCFGLTFFLLGRFSSGNHYGPPRLLL